MFDTHSSFMNGLLSFMVRFVVYLLALAAFFATVWWTMDLAFGDDDWVMEELRRGAEWPEFVDEGPIDLTIWEIDDNLTIVTDPEAGNTTIFKVTDDITVIQTPVLPAITCYDLGNGVIKCQ